MAHPDGRKRLVVTIAALAAVVEGVCFFNARDYFGLPLGRLAGD